ncbi:MAG: hypothetical protein HFI31_14300 [Lachnospiraceae bacterium]|nr:hypothetical protein [Lachnospiraceae bacterium]MCI9135334.1 hypothetical protein [Lachnospiraceae bacterium]
MYFIGACLLTAILNVAMVMDILTGKIKNVLILAGLALGLWYQFWVHGISGGLVFGGGALLPFVITFPLFAFRAVGAGDVKLLTVAGGFLGMSVIPGFLLLTLLLGGGMALLKMLFQRTLGQRFMYLAGYMEQCLRTRRLEPYGQPFGEEQAVIHLSIPILFAALICMMGGIV